MRGFNDSSVDNTLLDGLRLMSDQGSYSSFQIDPYFLQRIDVLKGPGSILYGRASPGGVVALTSKKPLFQPYHEVEVTVGNRNRLEGAFDISGPVDQNGVMAFRVTGLARGMDTQFEHVREQRFAIAPSLAINFTPDTHLLLQAYLQHDPEGGYHSGVPAEGSIFPRNGRFISRYFFDGDPTVEKFRRTQRMVGYQFEHAFNDQWTVRQNFRYVFGDTRLRQIYGYGWAGAEELTRYYSGAKEATHAYTVDNQLEGKFTTGPVRHTMLFGLDYQKRHVDGFWESGSADPINAFNPVYGNPGLTGVSATPIDRWLEQTGLYLQDQIAIDRWRFTLGVREDHAKASNLFGAGTPSEWSGSKFTKRAGVVYLFDNGIAPYFQLCRRLQPEPAGRPAGQPAATGDGQAVRGRCPLSAEGVEHDAVGSGVQPGSGKRGDAACRADLLPAERQDPHARPGAGGAHAADGHRVGTGQLHVHQHEVHRVGRGLRGQHAVPGATPYGIGMARLDLLARLHRWHGPALCRHELG